MPTNRFVAFGFVAALALPGGSMLRGCEPPPPPPPPPPPAGAVVEGTCITMVNTERANRGLAALKANALIETTAATHSTYQASIKKMTHSGAGGASAGTRLTRAGYRWSWWGENVAAGQGDCASVMSAWMGSSGHRANILNKNFTEIGVASAVGPNGVKYWTMILAKPG